MKEDAKKTGHRPVLQQMDLNRVGATLAVVPLM